MEYLKYQMHVKILSIFRENPREFWIEPDIIKVAIEKINN